MDLQQIRQAFPPHVVVLCADVFGLGAGEAPGTLNEALDPGGVVARNGPYDVVLSDMAPSTSGSKISDQARSFDLFMKALDMATVLGKRGSNFVGKIFMSDDFPKAKSAVASRYATVRVIRPEGTRSGSSEIFIVGLGLRTKP